MAIRPDRLSKGGVGRQEEGLLGVCGCLEMDLAPKGEARETPLRDSDRSLLMERLGDVWFRLRERNVMLTWDEIAELVLASLSEETLESSVVYLDKRIVPAGTSLELDGEDVMVPWPAAVVFIDLEPTANWAHDCRYVLVHCETGEMRTIHARLPPFLQSVSDTLRVIWKAEGIPHWALACD